MSTRTVTKAVEHILATTRDLTSFFPTEAHIRAKANFWTHFSETDTPVPDQVDLSTAARFSGDRRIQTWWSTPGFQDWFLNREEFKQRMEYLSNLCLDQLESILTSNVNPSDKLAAIKLIMQVSSKTPDARASDKQGKYLDSKIAEMSREQLEAYIRRSIQVLPSPQLNNSVDSPEET